MLDKSKEMNQSELLNTQMNAEENGNKENYSLLYREKLDGTPFHIVGTEEGGYFLVMGKYKITENKESVEEVKEYMEKNMWDVIVRMITTTHEMVVNSMIEDREPRTNQEFEDKVIQQGKEKAESERQIIENAKKNKLGY